MLAVASMMIANIYFIRLPSPPSPSPHMRYFKVKGALIDHPLKEVAKECKHAEAR